MKMGLGLESPSCMQAACWRKDTESESTSKSLPSRSCSRLAECHNVQLTLPIVLILEIAANNFSGNHLPWDFPTCLSPFTKAEITAICKGAPSGLTPADSSLFSYDLVGRAFYSSEKMHYVARFSHHAGPQVYDYNDLHDGGCVRQLSRSKASTHLSGLNIEDVPDTFQTQYVVYHLRGGIPVQTAIAEYQRQRVLETYGVRLSPVNARVDGYTYPIDEASFDKVNVREVLPSERVWFQKRDRRDRRDYESQSQTLPAEKSHSPLESPIPSATTPMPQTDAPHRNSEAILYKPPNILDDTNKAAAASACHATPPELPAILTRKMPTEFVFPEEDSSGMLTCYYL